MLFWCFGPSYSERWKFGVVVDVNCSSMMRPQTTSLSSKEKYAGRRKGGKEHLRSTQVKACEKLLDLDSSGRSKASLYVSCCVATAMRPRSMILTRSLISIPMR
jgi:hypothetical protein